MSVATMTTARVTAEVARLAAEAYILDEIGDQVMAGEPWPIDALLSAGWVVPLVLTSSAYGSLGAIGVLVIDQNTGQVVASTPRRVLEANTQKLLGGYRSQLDAAFAQQVASGNSRA